MKVRSKQLVPMQAVTRRVTMSYLTPSVSARILRLFVCFALSLPLALRAQILAFNPGVASLVAGGGTDASTQYNGPATGIKLTRPGRVALDVSENLYVVESDGKTIRVIGSGKGPIPSLPSVSAPVAGNAYTLVATGLADARGLSVDAHGNVYVADRGDDTIKVIYASGKVAGVAANPLPGTLYVIAGVSNHVGAGVDGVAALSSLLNQPEDVAVDANGNVFIADTANNRIRVVYAGGTVTRVSSNANTGDVYTVAGSTGESCSNRMSVAGQCGDGGAATSAKLASPSAVALDAEGNLYISDRGDSRVREVFASGIVPGVSNPVEGDIYAIAGTGFPGRGADGLPGRVVPLSEQLGQLALDSAGDLYILDGGNGIVRKLDRFGKITTVAGGQSATCSGSAELSGNGCPANSLDLNHPFGLAVSNSGKLFIGDTGNGFVREVTLGATTLNLAANVGGSVSRVITLSNVSSSPLSLNSVAVTGSFSTSSNLENPCATPMTLVSGQTCQIGVIFHASDTNVVTGSLEVASNATNSPNGSDQNVLQGSGVAAAIVPAISPSIKALSKISGFGKVHPEDNTPSSIPVLPGVLTTAGDINSVVGIGQQGGDNDIGPATSVTLSNPSGVVFDSGGNLYLTNTSESSSSGNVRVVNAASGIINPLAGYASTPLPPNGGPANGSWISGASSLAFDSAGNLFISAYGDSVIDEIPAGTINLQIYAGLFRNSGSTGEGGPALSAKLATPISLAIDPSDNLYVADPGNLTIRKITSGGGTISTVVGTAGTACFSEGGCGDGGPAAAALMSVPQGIATDTSGNLYISDENLNSVRIVYQGGAVAACLIALENPGSFTLSGGATSCSGATTPTPSPMPVAGYIYLLAGGTACGNAPCGDGGLASLAGFFQNWGGITIDGSGNIFLGDQGDGTVRRIDAQTGVINSVIGTITSSFTTGFAGDFGPAVDALIGVPVSNQSIDGLTIDPHGNLFYADGGNYNIRAVTAAAQVPLTPQTITFASLPNVAYGISPITLNATSDSGLTVSYSVSTTSPATISGSTLTITGAGTVDVTASQSGDATHSAATPVTQSFTVSPATLTVAATNIAQPAGSPLPSQLPFVISGLVGTDSTSGAPVLTTAYTTSSPLGTSYPITVTQGTLAVTPTTSAANYTFAFVNGTLTVGGNTPQTITFPALPATITYGDKPIALAATSSAGLPISYTATGSALVTGSSSAGWTLTILSAGQGTVTASQAGNTQFAAATSQSQAFMVKQATVIVTATNLSESFGASLPSPLPYTTTGLVGSDSLGGAPVLTTTYTTTSAPGSTYPIAVAMGTLTIQPPGLTGNYSFVLMNGTVTVTQGSNTITFPTITSTTYGSVIALNATASSGLPITYATTGNAVLSGTMLTITGLGPITVTASQVGNASYAAATSKTQSFNATQALLTVAAQPATRPQGALNPGFNVIFSGFVNGDANSPLVLTGSPIITTTATAASPPGNYPITPALGTLFSGNYTFVFVPGVLTVTAAPNYVITASPNALTIPIGQSGQTTLSVQAVNQYQGSITFSCGQVPLGLTCNFSPATINLALTPNNPGEATQSTLTVTTTGPTAQLNGVHHSHGEPLLAGFLLLPGIFAGLLLPFSRKRLSKRHPIQKLLMLIILFSGALGIGACGSSNNTFDAPLGNSTILVTATGTGISGSGSPNLTNLFTLTVNVTQLNQAQ